MGGQTDYTEYTTIVVCVLVASDTDIILTEYSTSDAFTTASAGNIILDTNRVWTAYFRQDSSETSPIDFTGTVSSMFIKDGSSPLQSLNGLPIGEENEKLKNIFSATPFI